MKGAMGSGDRQRMHGRHASRAELMMHRNCCVLLFVLVLQVTFVDATRVQRTATRPQTRLLQNIFVHSNAASTNGGWSKSSKKSKGSKGSKRYYPTRSPAPSYDCSKKGHSKGVDNTSMPATAYPTLSPAPTCHCENSKKNDTKKKSKGGTSKGSQSVMFFPTLSPAPSTTNCGGEASKKRGKGGKGGKGGSKGACLTPTPTLSEESPMPSASSVTASPTIVREPSTTTSPTVAAAPVVQQPAVPVTRAPVEPPAFKTSQPTAGGQVPPVASPVESPIIASSAPTASSAPVASPVQQPIVTTSEPTANIVSMPPAAAPAVETPVATTAAPSSDIVTEAPQASPAVSPSIQASEPPVVAPSAGASPGPTATKSPSVDATPFSATYEGVNDSPTPADCDAAAAVTKSYLETAFRDFFAVNPFVSLDTLTINEFGCTSVPARIAYQATASFTDDSDPSALPVMVDLDSLLQVAFEQPMVSDLLTELATLPAANPFSDTSSVTYSTSASSQQSGEQPTVTKAATTQSVSQQHMAIGFVSSVCAFVFIATAFNTMYQRKTRGNRTRRRRLVMRRDGSIAEMPYHSNLHASLCDDAETGR